MRYQPVNPRFSWVEKAWAPYVNCPNQTQLFVVRQLLNQKSKSNSKPKLGHIKTTPEPQHALFLQ